MPTVTTSICKSSIIRTLIFSRPLGSSEDAAGFAVTVDSSDNIIVAGQVFVQLTSSGFGGNYVTFVTKFNESGQEQFTRQAEPFANDGAFGLAVNSSDEIFVTGFTNAAVGSGLTHGGGTDGFVKKINSSGTLLYNKQFGSTGNEVATAIAISDVGEILVAGTVDGNGFLRKFADDSTNDPPIYNIDLGALGTGGDVTGVATNSQGEIFVSGVTTNAALSGTVIGAHSGNTDAFLIRLTESGGRCGHYRQRLARHHRQRSERPADHRQSRHTDGSDRYRSRNHQVQHRRRRRGQWQPRSNADS